MPRYYFDVHDKDGFFRDEIGLELTDIDAAVAEARRALADMTKELLLGDPNAKMIHIVIRDGADGPVRVSVTMETTWPAEE
jgi:hypothetical protein